MNVLYAIAAGLLALAPLIIFHELGHYWVARAFGVKVLRFSIGVGRVVWSRRFGRDQTEWSVSILPLGGYVQFLDSRAPGPVAAQDEQRDFARKNVWARIAIVVAGPLANLLLAVVLFAALFVHGVEEPGATLRPVTAGSAAYASGLRGGDSVVAVDGRPVASWPELAVRLAEVAMDGREARFDMRSAKGGTYVATIPAKVLAAIDPGVDILAALGMQAYLGMPVVAQQPGADAAGRALQVGDVVLGADGIAFVDGADFAAAILSSAGRTLQLQVRRGTATLSLPLATGVDGDGRGTAAVQLAPPSGLVTIRLAPLSALAKGGERTWQIAMLSFRLIGKLVTGDAAITALSGPVTIADVAGKTARRGLVVFLVFAAVLSVSVGMMNLLPVPVLDGGHLLFYLLEAATGRPLPPRVESIARLLGAALLITVIALAMFNDLARLHQHARGIAAAPGHAVRTDQPRVLAADSRA